jgi:hypothetical protein
VSLFQNLGSTILDGFFSACGCNQPNKQTKQNKTKSIYQSLQLKREASDLKDRRQLGGQELDDC